MIEKLEGSAVLDLIKRLPEQSKYDCKADLVLDSDDQKAELVKDITSIANAHGQETGYLFYGVDLRQPDPVAGLTRRHDDASLQQMVSSKLEKHVSFLYYETQVCDKWLGIAVIPPSRRRPHIVKVKYGKLNEGQIPIRCGSSTAWANSDDLRQMFAEVEQVTTGKTIGELLAKAAMPEYSIASLALETWQLAGGREKPEDIEWLRKEIVGFGEGEGTTPDYRKCRGYASLHQINPAALSWHNLDSIVAAEPDKFEEVTINLGASVAEIEYMLAERNVKILSYTHKFRTTDGKLADGWVYFTPDAGRWIITQIRNRVIQFLMRLQSET